MRIRQLIVAATVSSALVAGVMSVPVATAAPSSPTFDRLHAAARAMGRLHQFHAW